MAAGLGFKTFNTGDVLSASDVNGYLMQGVLVFASTAARDAAITAPAEGQFAFTKDTNSLFYYDGAAWVASGATGDIEGVTAGTGISGGGTSGTVTVTNSMATAIDAKGDLIVGTGADTFSRLAAGTNTYILTADSAEATGLKWAAPAAGGGAMTKITSATFTTQSSVGVNECFSSAYKTYYIIWSANSSVNGADLQFQWQYSTSTAQTTEYYGAGFGYDRAATITTWGFDNQSAATIYNNLTTSTNNSSFGQLYVQNVDGNSETPKYFGSGYGQSSQQNINYSALNNVARIYTGFLLKPDSGTITGRYQVYGLAN